MTYTLIKDWRHGSTIASPWRLLIEMSDYIYDPHHVTPRKRAYNLTA